MNHSLVTGQRAVLFRSRRHAALMAILLILPCLLHAVPGHAQEHAATTVPTDASAHDRATTSQTPDDAAEPIRPADPLADLTPVERQRLHALLSEPAPRNAVPASVSAPAAKTAAPSAPAAAATPAKPKAVSVTPDSLAGQVLIQATVLRHSLVTRTMTFGRLFGDIALSGRWLQREMVNPVARASLFDAFWRTALVMLVALGVEHLLLLAMRRPLHGLGRDGGIAGDEDETDGTERGALPDVELPGLIQAGPPAPPSASGQAITPAPLPGAALPGSPILPTAPLPQPAVGSLDPAFAAEAAMRSASQAETRSRDAAHRRRTLRLFRRVPFALIRLVLKLIPLGAFLAIGNVAATTVADAPRTQLVILAVTNIYGIGRGLWLLADMLLSSRAPGVRLLHVSDETARFLTRWWGWLVAVPVVAVCVSDVGRILDLPARAGQAIVRAVVLVEHILLAVLVWQTRHKVAASLHPPKRLRTRSFGRLLTRLADLWWIAALFFDAALWFVWAAQIRGGYLKMWQLFLNSCIIIVVCRLAAVMLLGGLDRIFRVQPDTELRYPGLEQRASRYYPALRRIVTWFLTMAGIVALLQAWGLPALTFFTSGTLGTHLLSAILTIVVTLIVGVLVWELVNGALDRQIGRFNDTNQLARAVRLQTLLPILRTLLFVVLGAILVLTVLSEIGVNIAPLLAGAGIIGVAVGFGSQKLVQDFITGIFLLVENAMQVGDNVTVAGVSGTVEHLSIRTLRLRGGDGSIQIIPFSSVSTVANMSRDYAVAAISISIAFSEDTDRVCDLLTKIGAELRAEQGFADQILAEFGLNGVDSLGEYAVAISGTMRCTVSGRWPVQREFNRRLRIRMTELGIALPQMHRTVEVPALPALLERTHSPAEAADKDTPHG